jgi:phage tail tape-measure protein
MKNIAVSIKLNFKGQNEVEELLAELGKRHDIDLNIDTSEIQAKIKSVSNPIKEFGANLSRAFMQAGLVIDGMNRSLQLVQGDFNSVVAPASEFEQLRIRLVNLYQDTEKAGEVFEKFKKIAATTPYSLQGVVEAGAQLKAFGMDAENTLKSVTDLAAYMGLDVVDAANAVGRAFAGGAGAADVLRERGVLELIKSFKGIDDLTELTLPEFRKAMLETFEDTAAGIAGSTTRLADSYAGAVSNMQDAWTNLRAHVRDIVLPSLTRSVRALTGVISELSSTHADKLSNYAENFSNY